MLRQMRREFAGAIHPARDRRDRREEIFRDAPDRRLFLAALTKACEKTQWQIHACPLWTGKPPLCRAPLCRHPPLACRPRPASRTTPGCTGPKPEFALEFDQPREIMGGA
jgi:hypothetical protein